MDIFRHRPWVGYKFQQTEISRGVEQTIDLADMRWGRNL